MKEKKKTGVGRWETEDGRWKTDRPQPATRKMEVGGASQNAQTCRFLSPAARNSGTLVLEIWNLERIHDKFHINTYFNIVGALHLSPSLCAQTATNITARQLPGFCSNWLRQV
jgi:hypothetical protein